MAKLQDYELEELFKDFLNDCVEPVKLMGMEYAPAYALYELDPIAYHQAYLEWLDGLDDCEDCEKNPGECVCEQVSA